MSDETNPNMIDVLTHISPILSDVKDMALVDMMASLRIDEEGCRDVVTSTLSEKGIQVADILGVEPYIRLRAKQWIESGGAWVPRACVVYTIQLDRELKKLWKMYVVKHLRTLWIDTLQFPELWLAATTPDAVTFLLEKRVPMCPEFFAHALGTTAYGEYIRRMAALVDMETVHDDFTWLMRAAAAGIHENVVACVACGADVNQEVGGVNVLAYAFGPQFRPDVFDTLVELGARLTPTTRIELEARLEMLRLNGFPTGDLQQRIGAGPTRKGGAADEGWGFGLDESIYSDDAY